MPFKQPKFLARVHQLARRLVRDSSAREDFVQDAMVHLCQVETDDQRHEASWYFQSCRFHILDRLKSGRSLDSHKRRHLGRQLEVESEGDDAPAMPWLTSSIDVLAEVSARDIFNVLCLHVSPADRVVLEYLRQGFGDTEIARQLAVDHSAVARRRGRIAAVAARMGISL